MTRHRTSLLSIAAVALAVFPAKALELNAGGIGVNVGGGGGAGVNANVNVGGGVSPPSVDVDVPVDVDIDPPAPMAPAAADSGQAVFALPVALSPQLPCGAGHSAHCERDASEGEALFAQAMTAVARVPTAVVAACREGIIKAASAYDPVQVDVVGAGNAQLLEGGGQIAPLVVRIVYDRQGGYETREARVGCQVDAFGKAVSLT